MKAFLAGIGVVLGLVVIAGLFYWTTYNGMVSRDEAVKQSWAQVQTDYQRRADLVPNLVSTVKGVANFEKDTLTAVVEARAKVGSVQVNPSTLSDPAQFKKFEAVQGQLSSALSRLMVVVEKYPELKATANFSELQSQLEGTENRIAVARRDFNVAVQDYNTAIRRAPGNIVANMSGFKEKPYFEADEGAAKVPEVKF
jgi:LemA protein